MKLKKNLKYGASALAMALLLSACSTDNAKQAADDAETNIEQKTESVENTVEEKTDPIEDDIEKKTDDVENKIEGEVDKLKTGIEDKEFEVSLDDAVAKFKETFNQEGIEISGVELDEDDGKYAYDIQGFLDNTEYEAKIDAESGEVISKEEEQDDDDDDRDDDIAIDFVEIISPKEAMEKALENNTGYVKSYEIDHDDDRLVYEIDIEDGDDVELDAKTGDILEK